MRRSEIPFERSGFFNHFLKNRLFRNHARIVTCLSIEYDLVPPPPMGRPHGGQVTKKLEKEPPHGPPCLGEALRRESIRYIIIFPVPV